MKKIIIFLLLSAFSFVSYAQSPFSIGANIGVAFPGSIKNVYDGGLSAEFILLYSLPYDGLDLTFTAGYNGLKYKPEYFRDEVRANLGINVLNFDPDWTATAIPVMLGARYKFNAKGFYPYLSGELGLTFVKFNERIKQTGIWVSNSNPPELLFNNSFENVSETGFAGSLGAGVEIPISKNVSVDLGFKYNYWSVTYSNEYVILIDFNNMYVAEEQKNPSLLSARLGVVVGF